MASQLSDDRLRELVVQAYREVRLPVALSTIESAARRRPRHRLLALAATAVAVVAVAVGASTLLPGQVGPGPQPGGTPTAGPSSPDGGKPPRPTSTATTAAGRCAGYALPELRQTESVLPEDRAELPPLRFQLTLIESRLSLLLYAEERVQVACWLTPESGTVSVNSSNLTTNRPAHPAGQLSNSASAHGGDPVAAYSFGRVPAGTTRVEVYFPDGSKVPAQLANGWYVAWATGEAAHRFSDITKVVAYTPNETYTQAVEHG
ncbi:MAG TPA: hypothetical protein VFM54_22325 [Micromonosporaceae bacterium]|nr:hypothetical protein [Micromonosporaceae bacterium]